MHCKTRQAVLNQLHRRGNTETRRITVSRVSEGLNVDSMIAPQYGVDDATQRQCLAANRSKGASESALKALAKTCRIKATPKKCRELSPIPAEKVSQSAQKICADACKRDHFAGDCALN